MEDAINTLKEAAAAHLSANYKDHKGSIILLLKEFARRLLWWIKAMQEHGISFRPEESGILLDVTFEITGKQVEIPNINELIGDINNATRDTYFDRLVRAAYVNFIVHKDELTRLGYTLPNPYEPYIEIFRRGGICLKFDRNVSSLEVYPFWGIGVRPWEKYRVETPFYERLEELDLADEAAK